MEGPRRLARYTFLGFDPEAIVHSANSHTEIIDRQESERKIETNKNPLATLAGILPEDRGNQASERYTGGLVGYASYDLASSFEKIPRHTRGPNEFPDMEFGLYLDGIVFDHYKKQAFYFYRNKNRIEDVRSIIKDRPVNGEVFFGQPKPNLDREKFCSKVERAKDYIRSGDVFQVVISKRYKIPFKESLVAFYKQLRRINPSPYMYYLKFGQRQIVGSSPEMLARKIGNKAETFPIAGTRPFTGDPSRNRALAAELLQDEKERAEHVMLVDLARNDLGRVSRYGTVRVPEFMKVQSYSHVQHIVSKVTGQLRREFSSLDLFQSVFPAGTVSGAPKVRAMQIIQELEPTARGPYAGAVGYFSNNGNADFAITIRTLCAQNNNCYVQAGAGIVADSTPDQEWIETERKAAALFTAMSEAQE